MSTPDPQSSQRIEHSSIQGSQIQQGQAGKNLTQVQADKLTQVYISVFGRVGDNRSVTHRPTNTEKLRLDLADQILKNHIQPELKQRLRNTVYQDVWLAPDIEEQPGQVGELTPNRRVQVAGKPAETLDLQTAMLEVFTQHKKLLILGEPGIGKTTTLLTLADQLVEQALAHPGTAIPVIFELSTWKNNDQSIEEWLIQQLTKTYRRVSTRIAEGWLKEELLIPLLDGLDELEPTRQKICVQLLNQFAEQYPYLVVCCRAEEYEVGLKLDELRSAIRLQPLTPTQIQEYLQQVGRKTLWEAVVTHPEKRVFLHPDAEGKPGILQIPLFLKIAAQAYAGKLVNNKIELLDAYIDQRLSPEMQEWERKNCKNRKWAYQKNVEEPDWRRTWHYLSWLAQNLKTINQTEFSVEAMQPYWLVTRRQSRTYFLVSGVLSVSISGFSYLLQFIPFIKERTSSLIKVAESLHEIRFSSLFYWLNEPTGTSPVIGGPRTAIAGVMIAFWGLVMVMAAWDDSHKPILPSAKSLLSLESLKLLPNVLSWVLIGGLLCGTVAVIFGLFNGQIAKTSLLGLFVGGYLGVLGWITVEWTGKRRSDDLRNYHFSNELSVELRSKNSYSNANRKANQGILNAGINALSIASLLTIFSILTGMAINQLTSEPFSPFMGLGFGVFWGFLFGGGIECIKHLTLRCILSRSSCIPWNYGQFLDYCVERRLLQRIGGRYRFLHRELLEHFADKAGGVS